MVKELEDLKDKLNTAKNKKGDWKTPYIDLMKKVYEQPVLFFALSKREYKQETHCSVPFISTKDFGGAPTLYIFSDVNTASGWMSYYKHVSPDQKFGLIGAVKKENNDFLQIFQIAKKIGVSFIMLDEGGSRVGLSLDEFLATNEIDVNNIRIFLTQEEMEAMMANHEQPKIKFAEIPAIPIAK